MYNILENFKQKIGEGKSVFGPFMKTSDPAFVEASGYAGFDFVILDMEHGPNSLESMQNLIRAACLSGTLPVIRTRDRQAESISQALDIGALGVQVPQVTSAIEIKEIVKAAKFSPLGERGVCRFVRAANYSAIPGKDYFAKANKALVIVQIEGREALKHLDAMLSEKGVDIFFIGPYDLSQSLGVPGEINHPKVLNAVSDMIKKSKEYSCSVGLFTDTMESAIKWKKLGVSYISYSVDTGIYLSSCKALIDSFNNE